MRFEDHPLFIDFAQVGERVDLVAAAVGQERAVPVHEAVDATRFLQNPVSRFQVEMVGIGQNDMDVVLPQFMGFN